MHQFLLHNERVLPAGERTLSAGQIGLLGGWGVFSTIRVVSGVLFAFERHWARMKRDAALLHVPFPADPAAFENRLLDLVAANEAWDSTLRVVVLRNRGGMWEGPGLGRDFDVIAFTTDLKDWGKSVRLGLVPQARHAACAFAGTKMLSWAFNLVWVEEAQNRGFDEVVLLNERGEVSECTSANLFVSRGSSILTPPLSSGCLPGVTREILLSEIHVPGISIGEAVLFPEDLEKADEVFITSTTRGLLPVESIDGLQVRRNDTARETVETAFAGYVAGYVAAKAAGRTAGRRG